MEYKIDLHTHSILSHDGGITEDQFAYLLQKKVLDCIAITDHNEVEFAIQLNKKYPMNIIIGEEIKTKDGEIIGLYLTKNIPKYLSLEETIKEIKKQGGITYLPHPFDIRRSGVPRKMADKIIDSVDIIEGFNPRNIIPGGNKKAENYGKQYKKPIAAGSDAHSFHEIGKSFTILTDLPTRENLVELIRNSTLNKQGVNPIHLLNPKLNKIKKLLRKK